MTFAVYADGQLLTADDVDTLMRQGVVAFGNRAARDAALAVLTSIPDGMTTWLIAEQVAEQQQNGSWRVAWASRSRTVLGSDYAAPVTSSAALATTWATFSVAAGATYRVSGGLLATSTLRVTSLCSGMTGLWGAGGGEGAGVAVRDDARVGRHDGGAEGAHRAAARDVLLLKKGLFIL